MEENEVGRTGLCIGMSEEEERAFLEDVMAEIKKHKCAVWGRGAGGVHKHGTPRAKTALFAGSRRIFGTPPSLDGPRRILDPGAEESRED